MRAFENCCLFKTGDTKWFPYFTFDEYILVIQILCISTVDLHCSNRNKSMPMMSSYCHLNLRYVGLGKGGNNSLVVTKVGKLE